MKPLSGTPPPGGHMHYATAMRNRVAGACSGKSPFAHYCSMIGSACLSGRTRCTTTACVVQDVGVWRSRCSGLVAAAVPLGCRCRRRESLESQVRDRRVGVGTSLLCHQVLRDGALRGPLSYQRSRRRRPVSGGGRLCGRLVALSPTVRQAVHVLARAAPYASAVHWASRGDSILPRPQARSRFVETAISCVQRCGDRGTMRCTVYQTAMAPASSQGRGHGGSQVGASARERPTLRLQRVGDVLQEMGNRFHGYYRRLTTSAGLARVLSG
jgi:hypothetical protein